MILCVRKRKNNYLCTQLGRADDHGTVCSDTDGTDCSASMVPITVLHLVPIQRYQQLGMTFFLSYSIMAFGLCYISYEVFSLNYPSIICAVISIYALIKLMNYKKIGYFILWICVFLFSAGSYWWLIHSIIAPIIIAVIGSVCMLVLTGLLKQRYNDISMWSKLS